MACLALEEYRRKRQQLEQLEEELDELRQRLDGRVTSSYSAVKAHSGDGRGLEARAIHLADVEICYVDTLDALTDLRLKAEEELDKVENDLTREVLTYYYIGGMTVRAIAAKAGRTEAYIFRLKAVGLEKLKGMRK